MLKKFKQEHAEGSRKETKIMEDAENLLFLRYSYAIKSLPYPVIIGFCPYCTLYGIAYAWNFELCQVLIQHDGKCMTLWEFERLWYRKFQRCDCKRYPRASIVPAQVIPVPFRN